MQQSNLADLQDRASATLDGMSPYQRLTELLWLDDNLSEADDDVIKCDVLELFLSSWEAVINGTN